LNNSSPSISTSLPSSVLLLPLHPTDLSSQTLSSFKSNLNFNLYSNTPNFTRFNLAEPKISTSGTRQNRRETWRESKGWKPKKTQGAGFFGGKSKNGGRVKRRR